MVSLLLKLSIKDNVHRQAIHSLLWSYLEYYVNSLLVCFKLKASPLIKLINATGKRQSSEF